MLENDVIYRGALYQTVYEIGFETLDRQSNAKMINPHKGAIVMVVAYDNDNYLSKVVSSIGVGWIWVRNLRRM